MDVDLLRPGTAPICPNTVLWFEFLLDKTLLINHLQKQSPDPSPTELITKFTTAIYECMKNDIKRTSVENEQDILLDSPDPKPTLKVLALKILSLKVAAYIKWNPVSLRALPFKVQISLLQDLLSFTNREAAFEIPNVPIDDSDVMEHRFALVLYHRWFVGTCMHRILTNVHNRTNGDITQMEESMICTQENIDNSLQFLNNCLKWDKIPNMLSHECFLQLCENSNDVQFDWSKSGVIKEDEFRGQIHYDLACFHFYKESYEIATNHFVSSMHCYKHINNTVTEGFCSIDYECLESYLLACNNQAKDCRSTLLQQFSLSIVNQYMGILNILIQDNKLREIPLMHRINLELDIQGALSSGKFTVARDLLPKIQALNAVRCVVTRNTSHHFNFSNTKNLDFLIWATAALWKSANEVDKRLLTSYYMKLIIDLDSEDILNKLLNHEILNDIFDNINIEKLKKSICKEVTFPDFLLNSNWSYPDVKNNPKLEIRLLEQQIISCYDPKELRELLVKLTMKNPSRPIWKINPRWELPIPLQSVITAIQRGFIQDFSFVMLAKSKELMISKDWVSCMKFLKVVEAEVQGTSSLSKLSRMVGWEILLLQITHLFEEWPAVHIDRQSLILACESCLKNSESVIPRTEIMEQCVLCLLNLGKWDFLINYEKPWSFFEIAISISIACQDIVKYKGLKKVGKDLWELVTPCFSSLASQSKRSSSGSASIMHRDSPTNSMRGQFFTFLSKLRDMTALAVVISMLAKLYNIVRDDGNLEVSVDYVALWPSTITNITSYNVGGVVEILSDLVQQALKYYPTSIPWLRLLGDINYSNSNFENGLKYYLQSLIVSTEYFNLNFRSEDQLYRRMIKCCTQLGCHTQAAVLCQFLDEPDYTLAFRSLVDFKTCNDSVEAFYHCFWDPNILEYLVHLHHKRGEFQRRKQAIHTIGMLEVNSNNNEEIQREAINLRKRTFLQGMCKQYIK